MIRRDSPSYRIFEAGVKLERRRMDFISGLQKENQ
jgi:hypothetical protein